LAAGEFKKKEFLFEKLLCSKMYVLKVALDRYYLLFVLACRQNLVSPKVANRAWFEGHNEEPNFVRTINRIMSGHTATHSHLNRFQITESPLWEFENLEKPNYSEAIDRKWL
jgi:hypothetical protein